MLFTPHTSHIIKSLLVAVALVFATAACDGPVGPQGSAGPEGPQGPAGQDGQDGANGQNGQQGPQGPAGEDGNANVTSYVFPGYDSSAGNATRRITLENESEVDESAWLHYFLYPNGIFVQVPGPGYSLSNVYEIDRDWDDPNSAARFRFYRTGGSGETIANIVIIHIEGSASVECPDPNAACSGLRATSESLIPADLDVSDYHAVMDYYGLAEDDIVRM